MISFNSHKGALFAILVACGVAAVACAESDDPSDLLQGELDDGDAGTSTADGGKQLDPTTDASDDGNVDVGVDANVDAGPDAAPAPKLCTVHGWCHTLLPSSQKLRDVWGDGTGIVWAVSEEGNILRYDGTSWTIAYTNTAAVPGPLYAIWGASPTDIWVGGVGGLFHGTGATSATLTWTHVATPTTLPVFSIAGTSATDVWAVAHDTGTLALNTSKSSLIHYAGPPADPADPMNGWTEDPTVSAVSGQLSKIWFAGPTDLWVGGGTIILKSNRQYANPLTWRRTVDTDGVGTWTRDVTLAGSFNNALFLGAVALDADRILAFGKYGSSPTSLAGLFNHWGTRASSSAAYAWKSAFASPAVYNATCSNQVHYGGEAFAANDIWLYGEYGRLCHYDGTAWTVAAVSLEQVPFTKTFFGSWASANEMWVVGQDIAIHKQRTVNP